MPKWTAKQTAQQPEKHAFRQSHAVHCALQSSFQAQNSTTNQGPASWDIPDRLNGPERRVGLRAEATRAPTQGPGFRDGEHSLPLGPGILARKCLLPGSFGISEFNIFNCLNEILSGHLEAATILTHDLNASLFLIRKRPLRFSSATRTRYFVFISLFDFHAIPFRCKDPS